MAHGGESATTARSAAVESTELVPAPGIAGAPQRRDAELLGLGPGPGAAYGSSGIFAPQPRPGAGHHSLVAVYEHDDAQSDGLATPAGQLRRLLPAAGIVASSAAVTGLAAGTVSPAAGFGFFALLLGGLSLVMIHVLRA